MNTQVTIQIEGDYKTFMFKKTLRQYNAGWSKEKKEWTIDAENLYKMGIETGSIETFYEFEIKNREDWEKFKVAKEEESKQELSQQAKEHQAKNESDQQRKIDSLALINESIEKYGKENVEQALRDAVMQRVFFENTLKGNRAMTENEKKNFLAYLN